jgi:hypothetical protein
MRHLAVTITALLARQKGLAEGAARPVAPASAAGGPESDGDHPTCDICSIHLREYPATSSAVMACRPNHRSSGETGARPRAPGENG